MYPLLTYGLAFLFGIIFKPILVIPLVLVFYFAEKKRLILTLAVFLTGLITFHFSHRHPLPGTYIGKGHLHIQDISRKTKYGKTKYFHKGYLVSFHTSENHYYYVPVTLMMAEKILSNQDYEVTGILKKSDSNHGFIFKPHYLGKAIEGSYSFAEMRYALKVNVRNWVTKSISDPQSASLLAGLATGDIDDKALMMDFSTLGLSHLLAVSGFHFALIAGILSTLLKPFFSLRIRSYLLVGLLGGYFIFLGMAPSIMRAFFSLLIFLFSPLFEGSSKGENSLGASLLLILVIDPFAAESIGFILSYLATGAILVFFPLIDSFIKDRLPLRSRRDIHQLNKLERSGLIIMTFLRQSFSLNIAILLAALPATLALFHQFPPFSLLYNLFFPLLLALSLLLLILSLPLPFLHPINSQYTKFILHLTQEVPDSLNWTWHSHFITPNLAIVLLSLFFGVAIYKNKQLKYT